MAGAMKPIKVLEDLMEKRYHTVDGKKAEIGNFWSVLQVYKVIRNLDISIDTLCKVASKIEGRVDSKHQPIDSDVNPRTLRKYLDLQVCPAQISHTVVTKTIAKGSSYGLEKDIEKVLTKYSSFGPDIMKDLCAAINKQKPTLIDVKTSVMGGSDFACVLQLCLILRHMYYLGHIHSLRELDNAEHVDTIIKTIKECQEKDEGIDWDKLGGRDSLRFMQI